MKINMVTIQDMNLPPNLVEFVDDFASCKILLSLDFFLGYNQVPLTEESHDLMGFQTKIELMRVMTLPQGATNSVAQFLHLTSKALINQIPDDCMVFFNNVGVKGLKSQYNNKEVMPGIH